MTCQNICSGKKSRQDLYHVRTDLQHKLASAQDISLLYKVSLHPTLFLSFRWNHMKLTQTVCVFLWMMMNLPRTPSTLPEYAPVLIRLFTRDGGVTGPLRFTGGRSQLWTVSLPEKRSRSKKNVHLKGTFFKKASTVNRFLWSTFLNVCIQNLIPFASRLTTFCIFSTVCWSVQRSRQTHFFLQWERRCSSS